MTGPLVCFVSPAVQAKIPPSNLTDRLLGLIVLIMFFAGIVLALSELVRWWKAQMERFERPPLSKVISYELHSDRRWHPTGVLWFRFPAKRLRDAALETTLTLE